jgi:hypothetical protein
MKAVSKFRKLVTGLVVLTFMVICANVSMAAEVNSISIVDYGMYTTAFEKWESAPSTTQGRIGIVADKELLELTDRIPRQAGTEFGVRYILNGKRQGKDIPLLVRVLHADTGSSGTLASDEWVSSRKIGEVSFDGWKLPENSRKVPTNFTIQLFHKGRKLAEKSFSLH